MSINIENKKTTRSEALKKAQKLYRMRNREKINEKQKVYAKRWGEVKYICDCGSEIRKDNDKHKHTKKHLEYINNTKFIKNPNYKNVNTSSYKCIKTDKCLNKCDCKSKCLIEPTEEDLKEISEILTLY